MKQTAKIQNIAAMLVFGTIGLFVRYIPLPAAAIAAVRGLVGALVLYLFTRLRGKTPQWGAIRKELGILALSGIVMGFNWMLLFEAYNHTTVATATLCYYLAPVFIILVSPLVLKERLTAKKLLCVFLALLGMIPVSGILTAGFHVSELLGVVLGVGAAVLYACVVLLNKRLREVSAMDRTMVQLFFGGAALVPYLLFTTDKTQFVFTPVGTVMLILVAVVHTGIAYVWYFGSLPRLHAQTAALLSYIDPVVAVLLSALVLKEELTLLTVLGAVLILGAAAFGEISPKKKVQA